MKQDFSKFLQALVTLGSIAAVLLWLLKQE